MNTFLLDLLEDLREKRLLPVAIAAGGRLVAVPVVLPRAGRLRRRRRRPHRADRPPRRTQPRPRRAGSPTWSRASTPRRTDLESLRVQGPLQAAEWLLQAALDSADISRPAPDAADRAAVRRAAESASGGPATRRLAAAERRLELRRGRAQDGGRTPTSPTSASPERHGQPPQARPAGDAAERVEPAAALPRRHRERRPRGVPGRLVAEGGRRGQVHAEPRRVRERVPRRPAPRKSSPTPRASPTQLPSTRSARYRRQPGGGGEGRPRPGARRPASRCRPAARPLRAAGPRPT